jgi:O-antigen/teichoic acid export membrane protein
MTRTLPGEPPQVTGIGPTSRTAVVQLVVRTGALRAITFLGSILLARVLLPADYGIFAVVIFLVGILAPIGELGLGAALIRQRDEPSQSEIATVFTAQQLVWLVIIVLVWLFAPLIYVISPEAPPDADWMLRVTALGLFIAHQQSVPNAMMSRVLRFGPLAVIEVVQQLVYVGVAVVLALNGAGAWSFVIGFLVEYCVGTVLTYIVWARLPGLGVDRSALRRLMGFGAVFQLTNLTYVLREALIPLFGGLAGGVTAIGYLQFGQRVGRLVGGFDEIAARVSFPAFSRIQDNPVRTARALVYVVESTALGLAALICWSIAAAPTLIPFLFGERWIPAVPVFQLTAFAALLGPPIQYLRGLGFAAGRARSLLRWSALAAAFTFVVFPLLVMTMGLVGGGLGFVIYAVIQLMGAAIATRAQAPFPWWRLLRIYGLGFVAAGLSIVVLRFSDGLIGLVVSGGLFVCLYLVLLIVFERDQLRRAWRLLRTGSALEAA